VRERQLRSSALNMKPVMALPTAMVADSTPAKIKTSPGELLLERV
jgi:hypothetical protein